MATGKAIWATNEGIDSEEGRQYVNDVAVTGSGDIIVTGYHGRYGDTGRLAKFDSDGTNKWSLNFDEFTDTRVRIVGETAYMTGTFTGAGITKFGGNLTSCNG